MNNDRGDAPSEYFRRELERYLRCYPILSSLQLSVKQIQQLAEYLALMQKWNRSYNLTAIRQPHEMLVKHVLDSLMVAPYVHSDNCIDVGTGAGLPGIPLAIVYPQTKLSLLDSNGKKTRFLQQVKLALDLDNVNVVHSRVEDARIGRFSIVLSRAFASLADMLNGCQHLCHPTGYFYAMKGLYPQRELEEIQTLTASAHAGLGYKLERVIKLSVPDLEAQRHLLLIKFDRH